MADEKIAQPTSSAKVRKRATIHAMIALDVEGDSDEEIAEALSDMLLHAECNTSGLRSVTLVNAEIVMVPFAAPPGGERWAPFAEIRLAEDRKMAPMHDGSWWWSDGHVMLRCEGEPPEGWRRIEDALKHPVHALPQRDTKFGAAVKESDGYEKRIASADDRIAVQTKYYDRIAQVLGTEAKWTCTTELGPVRAFDGDGRLMAMVMPVKRAGR